MTTTNKQIAAELYMRLSTVEGHLSYRKVGGRRAELAARLEAEPTGAVEA
jgi:DNA-binding NarL/FixJ family response regulator